MSSRGERNNNPGNLEASAWTRRQPGYIGSDGRFAQFATMQDGINAQASLLYNNYIKKGFDTAREIIWRYGNDPGTADDNSVMNYVRYVSGRLGITADTPIDPSRVSDLAKYMREFETGNTVRGVDRNPGNGGIMDNVRNAERGVLNGMGLDGDWWTNPNASITDLDPTGISKVFTSNFAVRFTSVFIGVILIALAIAAFVLLSNNKETIVETALKATT